MENYQGHREKINRCWKWGILKLLSGPETADECEWLVVNHALIRCSASGLDLRPD
jgi:hypothetical protein